MTFNWKSAFSHIKFIKKKPLVLPKIAKGFFKRLILRQNVLRTVDLAVTYDCHYKCEYCSAFFLKRDKPVLTVEEIMDIWQQALKLGAIHVNLTGGEPLARDIDELCAIIRNMSPKSTLISLVTNSLLVTREKLAKLKEAGLDTLQLSIESMNPEKNDRLRGVEGVFAKTMQALKYAEELGLNICLSAVLCHDNREDIAELLKFAKKEDVFLLLNPASSVGHWQGRYDKKMVQDDIAVFEKFMRDRYIRNDTSFNFTGKRGCPGGTERIHITAYGDVMTCPLVQVSYGNVTKEPLGSIFDRMNAAPFLKKYNKLCKQAFDKDYYEKICKPAEDIQNPPLSIFEHPNIEVKGEKTEIKKEVNVKTKMTLSVIIPCYNEKETITEVIKRINALDGAGENREIVVVDDGSTDGTGYMLKDLRKKFQFKLVEHEKNFGKSQAIKSALNFVSGDYVIIQDADLEYHPKDYQKLLDCVLENNAEVVYGSRRLNPKNDRYSGLFFFLGGIFLTLLANILYGIKITDEATGYKLFKTEILKDTRLDYKRFEFCPEVTAKIAKRGIKIYEVPISYSPRYKKEGKKINLRDGLKAIWVLIKYRFVD